MTMSPVTPLFRNPSDREKQSSAGVINSTTDPASVAPEASAQRDQTPKLKGRMHMFQKLPELFSQHVPVNLRRHWITAAGLLPLAMSSNMACAGSSSATFNVTATVLDACNVTATDMAFGIYDPTVSTDLTATSNINVNCSLGTAYTISLSNGNFVLGSTRRMALGSFRMIYLLFRDAASTQVFGSTANQLNATGVGIGAAVSTLVYGVIPKAQNVGPGSYSDQITVTVDY
jgi:spore coat protein U-like protein